MDILCVDKFGRLTKTTENNLMGGYDKNGNILIFRRNGRTEADSYGRLDNLQIMMSGNQVTNIRDVSSVNAYDGGTDFVDGVTQTIEYTYDNNGNLTKDLNKGITNISYNSLSLPQVVTFGNGSTITYLYTADGRKLRTLHVIGGTATTTDYCGNVIYENGIQKRLLTEVGYVDLSDNSYHFFIKDHLGNNRIIADANGNVEESNQYYPFGLSFASSFSSVQPYKYNGKELDTKGGLNWYDYGARHYDAALGRWHVVDPLSEQYYGTSIYAYCLDNPILQYDPDGCKVSPSNPVRRGYRNGGHYNPYALYPGGVQPQSYRQISRMSYKGGNGLYEKVALGEQNYLKDVTVGDNTIQMSQNNIRSVWTVGLTGLVDHQKQNIERLLEMSTEIIYHEDGRKSKVSNYVIKDEKLAAAQEEYSEKYNALSEQLGNDMSLLDKNAIIQREIGISPLLTVIMDMLMNHNNFEIEENTQVIPEFRQGY